MCTPTVDQYSSCLHDAILKLEGVNGNIRLVHLNMYVHFSIGGSNGWWGGGHSGIGGYVHVCDVPSAGRSKLRCIGCINCTQCHCHTQETEDCYMKSPYSSATDRHAKAKGNHIAHRHGCQNFQKL